MCKYIKFDLISPGVSWQLHSSSPFLISYSCRDDEQRANIVFKKRNLLKGTTHLKIHSLFAVQEPHVCGVGWGVLSTQNTLSDPIELVSIRTIIYTVLLI